MGNICYTPHPDSRRAIPSQFRTRCYPSALEAEGHYQVGWGSLVITGTSGLGDRAATS